MAAGVGVAVENHEGALSPEHDQVLGAIGLIERLAENTAVLAFIFNDVFHAPGRP